MRTTKAQRITNILRFNRRTGDHKEETMKKLSLLAVFGLICLLTIGSNSYGGALLLDPTKDSCGTANCGAQTLNGSYVFDPGAGNSIPFVVQVYSNGSECLRLDVSAASNLLGGRKRLRSESCPGELSLLKGMNWL